MMSLPSEPRWGQAPAWTLAACSFAITTTTSPLKLTTSPYRTQRLLEAAVDARLERVAPQLWHQARPFQTAVKKKKRYSRGQLIVPTGMPRQLYPSAHTKLSLMRLNVTRARSRETATSLRSSLTSTTDAASMATSVPQPTAIPTKASTTTASVCAMVLARSAGAQIRVWRRLIAQQQGT